jgi:hypothetical protein
MLKQPSKNWWTRIVALWDGLCALSERGLIWLLRNQGRTARTLPKLACLAVELLETRQLLSASPLATPYLLSVGQANLDLNAGAVRVSQALNLDVSNATDKGAGLSALDYNSATVNVRPVITLSVTTDSGQPVPSSFVATLTWNGTG